MNQSELTHVYDVLAPNAELVVASPKGGKSPITPVSATSPYCDELSASYLANKSDI